MAQERTVECPDCKHTFTVKVNSANTRNGTKRAKCPECGEKFIAPV